MKTVKFEYAQFVASDVQTITSIAPDTLRDWRRRGFLPKSGPGRAIVYSLADMAFFVALRILLDFNIPVGEARLDARAAANLIEAHALAADIRARDLPVPPIQRAHGGKPERLLVKVPDVDTILVDCLEDIETELGKLKSVVNTLLDLDHRPGRTVRFPAYFVIDCRAAGEILQDRVKRRLGRPLISVMSEANDND